MYAYIFIYLKYIFVNAKIVMIAPTIDAVSNFLALNKVIAGLAATYLVIIIILLYYYLFRRNHSAVHR